jgi:hypothetical protein
MFPSNATSHTRSVASSHGQTLSMLGSGCRARREGSGVRRLSAFVLPALLGLHALLVFELVGCAATPPAAAPTLSEDGEAAPGDITPGAAPSEPSASAAPAASDPEPVPAESGADDGLDADIAALSASTQTGEPSAAPVAKPAPEAASSGREIVYRVTPKGLVIEIDGIHLRPEAKLFKYESGAYGIDLVLNAESFDGRQYWLNTPKEGPLSIAGKIESGKAGTEKAAAASSRFADQREGGGEEAVLEGHPQRFKQRWPGRGQPKLWAGQTVTLEVGLWGVRAGSERERPVRRLFVVKVVAGPRAPVVISPPTMDWGT